MTIEIPDYLAAHLEKLAIAQSKSIEQLALDSLFSLIEKPDSPQAILRSIRALDHPSAAAVDDLEAAILAARLPMRHGGDFEGRIGE